MKKHGADRSLVLDMLEHQGGLKPGAARLVHQRTGIPEADVYGAGSFYSLLADHEPTHRVCSGLSCKMAGSDGRLAALVAAGEPAIEVSCLGQCDRAPVALDPNMELVAWGARGHISPSGPNLSIDLAGAEDRQLSALAAARSLGAAGVLELLERSGLQGRGGAGFPAHLKWRSVRSQADTTRYVVVNADEGEPGTFKDREVLLRRPLLMVEGMAIAAFVAQASVAYIYVRGEFTAERRALEAAVALAQQHLNGLEIRLVNGHGAYICGEETALIEAIEGRRGMPRLKPPYPTVQGLFGKPTLMNNVETLACVPSILLRGGDWFRGLGRSEPGPKLYCVSGHVQHPGVYELPLGVSFTELLAAAGGPVGTLKAFSPGGASSGFLPMSMAHVPLDFGGLAKVGSMLGSAGVVALNTTVDMAQVARWQQVFFEDETCGQCAPCRIGCGLQRQAIDRFISTRDPSALQHVSDVAWEMDAGSICGLGMVASKPLQTAMEHFPEEFGDV